MVNALALRDEEGRSERRNASGSGKHTKIRGYPNGGTQYEQYRTTAEESINPYEETQGIETS